MAKVRQDAWSHEDDLLLAETVLRHVREGSTQLNAFEEVGDELNRTSAACGFRWNAEVRKNYEDAMELAKRQRKERKRALEQRKKSTNAPVHAYKETYQPVAKEENANDESLTMDQVIRFLQEVQQNYNASHQSKYRLEQMQKQNKQLNEQVEALERELRQTEDQLNMIQEDYQTFIQIMDRARKMTVFEEEGSPKTPKFKMDKNGNLEQIAQGFE